VEYRRIEVEEERAAIYRLRYDAYLREGYIPPTASRRLTDTLEYLPNAWTFGIHVDRKLAGTIRMHLLTRKHANSFAYDLFPDVLEPELDAGSMVVDPNKFVVDREGAQRFPELPFAIVRLVHMFAGYFRADHIVASIRREHIAFYKRYLMFRPLCPPRKFDLFPMPVHLVGLHFLPAEAGLVSRFPFFAASDSEKRRLFARDHEQSPLHDGAMSAKGVPALAWGERG
jgi:hypothetical protein